MFAMARTPLVDRAEELLALIGRNRNWLARQLGIPKQKVYNWFDGQIPREAGTLERMVAFLEQEYRKGLRSPATVVHHELLGPPKIPVGFPLVQMRYAGEVPAGDWGDPLASEEFVVDDRYEHPKRFVARVVGDSCWPALRQGDLTVWHHDLNPQYGLIVLAQRKGDHACTVKQLVWDAEDSRPRLAPVNPDYDDPFADN